MANLPPIVDPSMKIPVTLTLGFASTIAELLATPYHKLPEFYQRRIDLIRRRVRPHEYDQQLIHKRMPIRQYQFDGRGANAVESINRRASVAVFRAAIARTKRGVN